MKYINEECVICNSELDDAEANGVWDLAAKICNNLHIFGDDYQNGYEPNQDCIYNSIRNWLKKQKYCPHCGAKMDGKEDK